MSNEYRPLHVFESGNAIDPQLVNSIQRLPSAHDMKDRILVRYGPRGGTESVEVIRCESEKQAINVLAELRGQINEARAKELSFEQYRRASKRFSDACAHLLHTKENGSPEWDEFEEEVSAAEKTMNGRE